MYRLHNKGFTLLEMCIVVVIAGLIIGAALFGRDLIDAAAATAQISQIQKYTAAAQFFSTKYGGLPGDLSATKASSYGFVTRSGGQGRGDGNGIIEGYDYPDATVYAWDLNGEPAFFWEDLSQAGLIDGTFSTATDANANCTTVPACNAYMPLAKIGNQAFVYVYSGQIGACCPPHSGLLPNYYGVTAISAMWSGALTPVGAITVQQAYNIDKKIDDSSPVTGNVLAEYPSGPGGSYAGGTITSIGWAVNAASGSASTCFDTSSGTAAYSINQQNGAKPNCGLSFKFQ